MNKETRKQRIEELKRKNLKKQLEEKFKCLCASITNFEFLTSKEIELRFQNSLFGNNKDKEPQDSIQKLGLSTHMMSL